MDWKKEIGIAFLVRQKVAEVDRQHVWPFALPQVGATEDAMRSVEGQIGNLPVDYRAFLRCADGWDAFCKDRDLFGLGDLVGGPRMARARQLLATLSPLEDVCGLSEEDVLPIGASQHNIDLFVISRVAGVDHGKVYWLAGQLVEQYPRFSEFFLAMVDYSRMDVAHFTSNPPDKL